MSGRGIEPRVDWTDFVDRYWEKAPTVLRGVLESPIVSAEDFFSAVVAAATAFREPVGRERHVRVFAEGRQLHVDLASWLPTPSHRSLDEYLGEKEQVNGFGLVINQLQLYCPSLYFALRDFSAGLFERTGLPFGNAVAVTFIGNYRRTAFGIHRDDYSNFQFVLSGRKRYRVWPTSVFGDVQTTDYGNYSQFLDQSILLEAEAGDVIYWPASYYHVAETDGESAASLAFVIPIRPPRSWVFEALERAAPAEDERRFGALERDLTRIPAALSDVWTSVPRDGVDLEALLLPQWLAHRSSAGMLPPPPLAAAALDDELWLAADSAWPIHFVARDGVAVLCANGHAVELPAHPCIAALVDVLNTGRPHKVEALVAAHQGSATIGEDVIEVGSDEVRGILETLYSFRALSLVARPA